MFEDLTIEIVGMEGKYCHCKTSRSVRDMIYDLVSGVGPDTMERPRLVALKASLTREEMALLEKISHLWGNPSIEADPDVLEGVFDKVLAYLKENQDRMALFHVFRQIEPKEVKGCWVTSLFEPITLYRFFIYPVKCGIQGAHGDPAHRNQLHVTNVPQSLVKVDFWVDARHRTDIEQYVFEVNSVTYYERFKDMLADPMATLKLAMKNRKKIKITVD
jgi:hypothetical protein